jgi:plastocyanin
VNHPTGACVSPVMPSHPIVRRALALAAVALLAAAGCGSDDDAEGATGDPTTTAAGSTGDGDGAEAGTIVAADFSLTDLTVAPGEAVVLRNDGAAPHTATADDGSFDTGQVSAGGTSEPATAPDDPGSYPFHCEIHSTMTATLTVEG